MTRVTTAARRRMYRRDQHPSRLASALNRGTAALASRGVGPRRLVTLEVAGRRTGRTLALPVVVADHEGERYLVAMLGERTGWVANVRAADGRAALRHGRREQVRLHDVAVADRAPVLRRYLALAPGARAHFPVGADAPLEALERIAADYPVFRITPA